MSCFKAQHEFQLNVNHPKSLENLSGLLVTMISPEKHTERTRLLKLIRIHCKKFIPEQQAWWEYAIFPSHRYHIPAVKTNRNASVNTGQAAPAPRCTPAGSISGSSAGGRRSVVHCPLASKLCTARHCAVRHCAAPRYQGPHVGH